MPEEQQKTCRICGFGPYSPSFTFDFYEDDVDGEGTGRCEKCMMNPPSQVEMPDAVHCWDAASRHRESVQRQPEKLYLAPQ